MLELIIGDGKSDIKTYTNHFLNKGNIKYKTAVPFHYFQIPLQAMQKHHRLQELNQRKKEYLLLLHCSGTEK